MAELSRAAAHKQEVDSHVYVTKQCSYVSKGEDRWLVQELVSKAVAAADHPQMHNKSIP
ncbi:hypothetical protein [Sinorhizobium sp. 22678]|jgi:hypothetical protein|uniref:hypothetical protein n=1 Tax=Sinorhizobium sp. 22678 TaxID=3453955 RepID=UPI003F86131B